MEGSITINGKYKCPKCGKAIEFTESDIGKKITCENSKCKHVIDFTDRRLKDSFQTLNKTVGEKFKA